MILTENGICKALLEQVSQDNDFFSAQMQMPVLLINKILQMLPQDLKGSALLQSHAFWPKGITLSFVVEMDIKVEICHPCLRDSYCICDPGCHVGLLSLFVPPLPFGCVGHRQWVGTTAAVASGNATINPPYAVVPGPPWQEFEMNLWQQLSVMVL